MRRTLAVLAGVALAVAAPARAHANPAMQRVVIDRVDLEPSPIFGYARLRVFVSAVDLAAGGKVMEIYGDHGWKLQLSGGEQNIPYLAGLYDGAGADTALVIVVETAAEYGDDLQTIKDALDQELLAKLPPRTQVAIIGYGDALVPGKLGPVKNAQTKLAALAAEPSPGAPSLLAAVDKAMSLLKKAKTDPEGLPLRKIVLIVSDGVDKNDDREKVTSLGKRAAQQGVRIDAIAYTGATGSKGPLLNLGELSKQSLGTFRWAQKADGLRPRIVNAFLELDHQYVLTWLVVPDDVAGKKIAVTAQVSASQAISSNDAKVPAAPTCAGTECPEDGYCSEYRCVQHAQPKSRGIIGWLLLLVGGAVGLLAALIGVGFVITRAKKKGPKPAPMPGAIVMPPPGARGVAPAPAAPAAPVPVVGPQLYMMNGPRSGHRIGVRHGFLIGKQPGCDLVLEDDGFASSQHAQILMDQGGNCTLIDKGSTNGTFVNGVRVTQYALTHGVAIRVGSTELRFLAQ